MINYTLIDNNLITNLKISDRTYGCYNLLLSLCYGNKTTCYPSVKYIACCLGRNCRTINRYIKELVKNNLISKRRRGSISNIYNLLQKKMQQEGQKVVNAVKRGYNAYTSHKTCQKSKKDTFMYGNGEFTLYNKPMEEIEKLLLGRT